jgi:hypothetical protein
MTETQIIRADGTKTTVAELLQELAEVEQRKQPRAHKIELRPEFKLGAAKLLPRDEGLA